MIVTRTCGTVAARLPKSQLARRSPEENPDTAARYAGRVSLATPSRAPAAPPVTQTRPAVLGRQYVVSSCHYLATQAGMRILQAGGNAIDGGVAAGIALNVLERDLTDFGGVAPIMIFRPGMAEPETIDGLGHWPMGRDLTAHRRVFGDKLPAGIPRTITPGAPDAWLTALARHGRLSLAEVLGPAIDLADNGFPVNARLATAIEAAAPRLRDWPTSATVFLPGGRPLAIGELLIQKDLATTFRRLVEVERTNAARGRAEAILAARDDLYRGSLAAEIARYLEAQGSALTADDLARHAARIERPSHTRYRDTDVFACGPWSQGPLVPMTLNLLANLDVAGMGAGSVELVHHFVEAFKLACADREGFFGDPEFVDVPLQGLTSAEYARQRRQLIDPNRASPDMPLPGDPWPFEGRSGRAGYAPPRQVGERYHPDTSYVCVLDAEGNAFSATPSDPGLDTPLIPGLGMVVSPRGSQLWLDAAHPSAIAPGKRPRLTPNPAMLVRDGRALMPFGTPGGDAQGQAMVQVVINVLDFGMNVQQAIDYPRAITASFPESFFPHESLPGVLQVEARFGEDSRAALERLGHRIRVMPEFWRGACTVCAVRRLDTGALEGGADPRRDAAAAGW
jgi:gamma-glutamyltranspeptidase / glutathione hydrolase